VSQIEPVVGSGNHRAPVDNDDDRDDNDDNDHDDREDIDDFDDEVLGAFDAGDSDQDDEFADLVHRLGRAAVPIQGGTTADLVATVARQAAADGLLDVAWTLTDSPVGPLTLAATPAGLIRIAFGHEDDVLEELAQRISPRVLESPARLDDVRRQLDEYFAGRRQHFDVALDWSLSQGFRRTALQKLVEVPYGHTVSYKELAERAGNPKASRATGTAMATNPIPLVVPCHRVLRSGGKLGGYGGGLDAKVWLLRLEGHPLLA
jgi:methylated-DNA-[protein]-cysteine S-methyltransferase